MKKALCILLIFLLICPAAAQTVQDQALAFFQRAGIAADSVIRIGNEIIITLPSGGTASLCSQGDFDRYDLSWRFDGASDGEVEAYLDHAMTLLAGLEKKIPADLTGLSANEQIRAKSYAVIIEKGLLGLERTGQQGLRILMEKLAAHDGSDLNSLRARLASRLLGEMDNSPVDPAQGCAWYDALALPVQDDQPPAP